MAAQQVVHGGRRAGVRHVDQLDAGGDLEQLRRQVRHAAEAGRGEDELAGLGLGERNQLGQRLGRHALADHRISGTDTICVMRPGP